MSEELTDRSLFLTTLEAMSCCVPSACAVTYPQMAEVTKSAPLPASLPPNPPSKHHDPVTISTVKLRMLAGTP